MIQAKEEKDRLEQKCAPYKKLEKLYEVFLEVKGCLNFNFVEKTHSAMDLIASVLSDSKYYLESLYNKASQEWLTKENAELLREKDNLTKENAELKTDKENLNNQLDVSQMQVNALENSHQVLENEKDELLKEKENLTKEKTELTEKNKVLTTEKDNLTRAKTGLKTETTSSTTKLSCSLKSKIA